MAGTKKYWVTWKDESDATAARKSAIIWGPQLNAPPQLSGWFLAGSFATKADAQAYKNDIGKNTLLPPKGTPILGGQKIPNPLGGIDDVIKYVAAGAKWISDRNNIFRIVKVGVGVGLIFMGLQQLKVVQQGKTTVVNGIGKASKVAALAAV